MSASSGRERALTVQQKMALSEAVLDALEGTGQLEALSLMSTLEESVVAEDIKEVQEQKATKLGRRRTQPYKLPLLNVFRVVGKVLNNWNARLPLYLYVVTGAVLTSIFGNAEAYLFFSADTSSLTQGDTATNRALFFAVARGLIVLAMWLSLLNSLRRVTRYIQKNEDRLRKSASKESARGFESQPATSADVFEDLRASLSAKERKTSATDLPPIPGSRRATETEGTASCPSRGLAAAAAPPPTPGRARFRKGILLTLAKQRMQQRRDRAKARLAVTQRAREKQRDFKAEKWGDFWLSLLHTSESCYLIFAVTAAIVLTLGFTAFAAWFGVRYVFAENIATERDRYLAGFVWWVYAPTLFIVWGLWICSLALGTAIIDSALVDGAAQLYSWEFVQRSRHSDEPNDVYLVRKLLWEYLHPLNDGWAFALSLQAVLSAATAFATALAALLNNFFDENVRVSLRATFFAISVIATGVLALLAFFSARVSKQCNKLLHSLNFRRIICLSNDDLHGAQRTSLLIASLEADKRFGFPLAGQKVTPRMLVKAISLMVTVFIFLTPLIQEDEAGSGALE